MNPSMKLGPFPIHQRGDGPELVCPVCNFDYVHLARVDVAQGTVHATITHEQVNVHSTSRGEHARGSKAMLSFWCENGHGFEYHFEFHKGMTALQVVIHPECVIEPAVGRAELWRS